MAERAIHQTRIMRQPKPYFKQSHKGWYANIGPDKRPVRLASEEEGETLAWEKYHSHMANRQPVNGDCLVAALLDRYLDRKQPYWAQATCEFHAKALSSFARSTGASYFANQARRPPLQRW